MAFTDLITGAEVVTDAINSTRVGAADAEMTAAITDVTSMIEEELNRTFIVRSFRLRIKPSDWCIDERYINSDLEPIYVFRPKDFPVVEILAAQNGTVTDVSAFEILEDGHLIGLDLDNHDDGTLPVNLDVFAGYRRSDQNLEALQAELATLTATPDVLPAIVRRTASELVLRRLTLAETKMLAGISRTQVVAGQTVTVDRPEQGIDRQLIRERLTAFRRFNF
jgi:hypothetical protein